MIPIYTGITWALAGFVLGVLTLIIVNEIFNNRKKNKGKMEWAK